MNFEEILNLVHTGQYALALLEIDSLKGLNEIDSKIIKCQIFIYELEIKEAIELSDNLIKISQRLEIKDIEFIAIVLRSLIFVYIDDWKNSLLFLEKASNIIDQETINFKPRHREWIANLYYQWGLLNIFSNLGNSDKSLEFFNKALNIQRELGFQDDIAWSLWGIGRYYQFIGEFNESLSYYFKSLQIWERLHTKQWLAFVILGIGEIFFIRGDLDKAEEYYKRSHSLRLEGKKPLSIAYSFYALGLIESEQGKKEKALEYFQKSLTLHESLTDEYGEFLFDDLLFDLILTCLDLNQREKAHEYANKLFSITEKMYDNRALMINNLTEAILLKSSPRLKEKIQSQIILEKLLKEKYHVGDKYLSITIFHLAELLIEELKTTNEEEVYEELKKLIKNLTEIGEKQQSYIFLTNVTIIQARFDLIEGNFKEALERLDKIFEIAKNNNLKSLETRISIEKDEIFAQIDKWKKIIELDPSFHNLINESNIKSYIGNARKFLSYK